MKWVARFKDKVGLSHSSSSSALLREQVHSPATGSGANSRNKYESELDFKRLWEEFRSANSEKEKETALEMAVDVFCRLARQNGNPSQIVNIDLCVMKAKVKAGVHRAGNCEACDSFSPFVGRLREQEQEDSSCTSVRRRKRRFILMGLPKVATIRGKTRCKAS